MRVGDVRGYLIPYNSLAPFPGVVHSGCRMNPVRVRSDSTTGPRVRLVRSLFYSAAGSQVEMALGVVTSIVIARSLGASDYGVYSLLLMWAVIAQSLVNSGVSLGVQRFVAQAMARRQQGVAAAIARRLLGVQFGKLAIGLGIVAVALPIFGRKGSLDITAGVVLLVLLAIAFRTFYIYNNAVCKGASDFRRSAIVAWIGSVSNLILVCGAGVLALGMTGFLSVYVLSSLAFLLLSAWAGHRYFRRTDDMRIPDDVQADVSRHLRIGAASAVIGQLASTQIELFFLGAWASPAEAGYFRLGNMLATGVVSVVSGVVAAVVMTRMSEAVAEGQDVAIRTYGQLTRLLILLALPAATLTAVLSQAIVQTLYGAAFAGAATVLLIGVFAMALEDINTPAQAYLVGTGRQYSVLAFTTLALALKLTLGAWLIHHMGLPGAIASWAGTVAIVALLRTWLTRRHLGASFPLGIALRVALISAVAAAPAFLLVRFHPSLPSLVGGGAVFCVVYAVAVLFGRCFSAPEIAALQQWSAKLPRAASRVAIAILGRARTL